MLLVPAVLLFGLGSALEVFHPVEEGSFEIDESHHIDESRAAIHAHDVRGPSHHHEFCAHANAVAHVAGLPTAFGPGEASVELAVEPVDRPITAILHVRGRGPPVLL
jgi:hypothetical protein